MHPNEARQPYLAILASPASDRRAAERRLSSLYRRAKRIPPHDLRALALAVALTDVSDEVFMDEMTRAEMLNWQRDLPPTSTVKFRLAWDASMDGDYGVREVRGWDSERISLAGHIVRESRQAPLSNAVSKMWEFDRRRSAEQLATSPVCSYVPPIRFDRAPKDKVSSIRESEPYFLNPNSMAVGVYSAWYGLNTSVVLEYELGLHSWMKAEWPEALEVFTDDEPLAGHPFSAWAMKRAAEALARRLSFEEATVMMMNDQAAEDKAWL